MPTLAELNAASEEEASALLTACNGSSAWVREMVARRPFASRHTLMTAADEAWGDATEDDWREAFTHHPRIGEAKAEAAVSSDAQRWSGDEQTSSVEAAHQVRVEIAAAQRTYEQRFGYIFIICATGRSAGEILAAAEARLPNDPAVELRVAAEEQRKITASRLAKLLDAPPESRP
ncbi:MAG: 2-oxo-4-hydroxy-4-carboxy-5-ureidoimidazoline decarboxylase [Gemmatimonadaceae bacterium]